MITMPGDGDKAARFHEWVEVHYTDEFGLTKPQTRALVEFDDGSTDIIDRLCVRFTDGD